MMRSASCSKLPRLWRWMRGPKVTLSRTVSQGNSADSWNTTARSGPGRRGGPPSILRLPAVGCSKPATMLSRVDLPQPEGPSSATNSPSPTARSTPVSAVTGLRPA